MASIASTSDFEEAPLRPRVAWWRGPRFLVEVFDGADEALTALEAVQGGINKEASLSSTGFQSLNWLTVFYEELAVSHRALPRLVVVTERNSREVAMILPLIVKKKRMLRVARFPDFGVADYGAPILGPALLVKPRSIRRAWRAIRYALRDVDLIRLEKMPGQIAGRANPLISMRGISPSRASGSAIHIAGTVEEFLAALDAKARDRLARGFWRWLQEPAPRFNRAMTQDEVAHGFAALEEQQEARHPPRDPKYKFADPAFRQFYERLVIDGTEAGLSYVFTLESGGDVIAALLGIEHDGVFTVLRSSDAGQPWRDLEPGSLIFIEVMKYFVERGIRNFDLGLGDHPFRPIMPGNEVALRDLIVARDLAAVPRATFHRVKGRARKNQRLRAIARAISRLGRGR